MADGTDALGLEALKHLLDRPIAYQRAYCCLRCGITGALMLSQAVYWQLRVPNDGDPHHRQGWWWHTQSEWHDETGLSRTELVTARSRLVRTGVLAYRRMGVPARGFYRVDFDRLLSSLQETCKPLKGGGIDPSDAQFAGSRTSGTRGSCNQGCGKMDNSNAGFPAAMQRPPQTPKEQQHVSANHVAGKKRQRCRHGVLYWYDDEREGVDALVASFGASAVESVAAKINAMGEVPYLSVVRVKCARNRAGAVREAARSQWRCEVPQDAAVEAQRLVQYVQAADRQPSAELLAQAGASREPGNGS